MSAAILAMALFTVCTTFLRGNEYLTTRSDFVRNQLETVSNERLKRYTREQRGKEPNALRFQFATYIQSTVVFELYV